MWSTGFETGDLSDWTSPSGSGGTYGGTGPSDASIAVVTEQAHGGRYAAKLTSVASFANPVSLNGSGLFKIVRAPRRAYYSAWYFVPEYHQTPAVWTLLQLDVPTSPVEPVEPVEPVDAADAGALADADASAATHVELLGLALEALPPSDLALVVTDARPGYLRTPLASPPPIAPVGRWFQIECLYVNAPGSDGELAVWLDGALAYDVRRPMSNNAWVYFMPCSLADDLAPSDATLYIDDVAVSWSQVTPTGTIGAAP